MRAQIGGLAASDWQGWDQYWDTVVPEPPSEPPHHSVSTWEQPPHPQPPILIYGSSAIGHRTRKEPLGSCEQRGKNTLWDLPPTPLYRLCPLPRACSAGTQTSFSSCRAQLTCTLSPASLTTSLSLLCPPRFSVPLDTALTLQAPHWHLCFRHRFIDARTTNPIWSLYPVPSISGLMNTCLRSQDEGQSRRT